MRALKRERPYDERPYPTVGPAAAFLPVLIVFSLVLLHPAFGQTDDECAVIKKRFYQTRDVESLLELPFGIRKTPNQMAQEDYEDIGRKLQKCMPTQSVGAIDSKMASLRRRTDMRVEGANRRLQQKNREDESLLSGLSRVLDLGRALNERSLEEVKRIDRERPELHDKVTDILSRSAVLQAQRQQEADQRAQKEAEKTAKAEAETRAHEVFIAKLKDDSPDCAQMQKAMEALKSNDPSKDVQRATELAIAGEEGEACQIFQRIKERYEDVRKITVACSKSVAKLDDPLAGKVSSDLLGKAALVRFLSDQSQRDRPPACGGN